MKRRAFIVASGTILGLVAAVAVRGQSGANQSALLLETAAPAQVAMIPTPDGCPNGVPSSLRLTLTQFARCQANGLTAVLTYNANAKRWEGSGTQNGITLGFEFYDGGTSGMSLFIYGAKPDIIWATFKPQSCAPFFWQGLFNDGGRCCDNNSPFTITIQ